MDPRKWQAWLLASTSLPKYIPPPERLGKPFTRRGRPSHANDPKRPAPADIRAARHSHGLTLIEAGALIGASPRSWCRWEAGDTAMDPLKWEAWRSVVSSK